MTHISAAAALPAGPIVPAVDTAAAITPVDRILEPSAGTGLLAILAEIAGGSLVLNGLADTRADLLAHLFPDNPVTRFDAAQIHDHLDPAIVPSVVLMNPPFSAMANVSGRMAEAAYHHVASALARLAEGGRLVTITDANFAPDAPAWRDAFIRLQEHGRVVFTAAIDRSVYAKHGTTIDTRLIVIDKLPADDPAAFPASPGIAPDVAALMGWIGEHGEIIGDEGNGEDEDAGDAGKPLSDLLIRDLTAHRTLGLRLALGEQPDMALVAVVHALAAQTFYRGGEASCLEIRLTSAYLASHADGIEDTPAAKALADRHAGWASDMPRDVVDLWAFVAGLDNASLMALLAHCAAMTVNAVRLPWEQKPNARATASSLATALDMTTHWTPTGQTYLGRVTKAHSVTVPLEAVAS